MNKKLIIFAAIVFTVIGGFVALILNITGSYSGDGYIPQTMLDDQKYSQIKPEDSLVMEDGVQIINIIAKGGYYPGNITAKADQTTKILVKTDNTFDCSTSLMIPSLKISKRLPANAVTEIEIPTQAAGSDLLITCSMAMYKSTIKFN